MRHFPTLLALSVAIACGDCLGAVTTTGPEDPGPAATEMLRLGLRGVYFVPNQGQWSDSEAHFGLRSRGLDIAFRESALTMHLAREVGPTSRADAPTSRAREEAGFSDLSHDIQNPLPDSRGSSGESGDLERLTLTITFPGSNDVLPVGGDAQAAKFNYFVVGEGRSSASGVPSFGAVVYENLYDGVDLHVRGSDDGVMKYEFRCAPGADYSQIRIAYDGIDSLCIDDSGDLQINSSFGTLSDAAPLAWHDDSGAEAISAHFALINDRAYAIIIDGPVDPTRELVIDPEIQWMHYVGGSDSDIINAVCADSSGTYTCGGTFSSDFEGRLNEPLGADDGFVARMDHAGQVVWMTFIGGAGQDMATGIDLSIDGVVAVGMTRSHEFGGANNLYHGGSMDAFALQVDSQGSLQWMHYVGGEQDDWANDVACTASGDALVGGWTVSLQWDNARNGHHGQSDAFIIRLNEQGEEAWMCFVGGSGADWSYSLALDPDENVYTCGYLASVNLEGARNSFQGGTYDGFAARVSGTGWLSWAAYLGGSDIDTAYNVDLLDNGEVLVIGTTESLDFPGRSNSFIGGANDGFLARMNPTTGAQRFMKYAGGTGSDEFRNVAVGPDGRVFFGGTTKSPDFEGARNRFSGRADAFIAELTELGAIGWMFYLGGREEERGLGVAAAPDGSAYVAGRTMSTRFVGERNPPHGSEDGFLVRVSDTSGRALRVQASCPQGGPILVEWEGATRDAPVALIYSSEQGSLLIPGGQPCAGTSLGLGGNQTRVVFTGDSGPEGARSLSANASPGACGGFLQMLDLSTCGPSNVARIE